MGIASEKKCYLLIVEHHIRKVIHYELYHESEKVTTSDFEKALVDKRAILIRKLYCITILSVHRLRQTVKQITILAGKFCRFSYSPDFAPSDTNLVIVKKKDRDICKSKMRKFL